ncbi:hypothetical protein ACFOM8_01885 [Paracoccus angustae]|uniref:Uncharacterized protein n=1 Tax=Paracoccus angustae TaxID=1671480 RepID=A0ABV7TZQ2_9RHOB
MPISQTTITGSVKTPDDQDAAITGVKFTLSGSDYEAGEIIAKKVVEADVTTATGDFTVTLWPNDKGIEGTTKYTMAFTFDDGSSVTSLKDIYVRHSDTPKSIEEIAADNKLAGAIKGFTVQIITAAQYAALNPKAPNTAYLIKG